MPSDLWSIDDSDDSEYGFDEEPLGIVSAVI